MSQLGTSGNVYIALDACHAKEIFFHFAIGYVPVNIGLFIVGDS
jgi:hypothetical protein